MNELQNNAQVKLAQDPARGYVICKHIDTGAIVSLLPYQIDRSAYKPVDEISGPAVVEGEKKDVEVDSKPAWVTEQSEQASEENELAALKAARVWLHGSDEEKARFAELKAKYARK